MLLVSKIFMNYKLLCWFAYLFLIFYSDFRTIILTFSFNLKVLVHGEMTEMARLKSALEREYEGATVNPVKVFNPKNLESVKFYFRGEKMAKVNFQNI